MRIRIGATALVVTPRRVCSHDKISQSCSGDPKCRRLSIYPPLKQNITPPRRSRLRLSLLNNLLHNMGFKPDDETPVYENNTACIEWETIFIGGRERAKHFDIRKYFAHEAIQNRHMRLTRLTKVGTDDQMADILTNVSCFRAMCGRWCNGS